MPRLPANGQVLIISKVGNSPSFDFYRAHGSILTSSHRNKDNVTHIVFMDENGQDLISTVPRVIKTEPINLDEESVAALALSNEADERRTGVMLMQARQAGFTRAKATLWTLSPADDGDTLDIPFEPGIAMSVAGSGPVPTLVMNTYVRST